MSTHIVYRKKSIANGDISKQILQTLKSTLPNIKTKNGAIANGIISNFNY